MSKAQALLRENFGYDSFLPGQEALIEQCMEGRDVLGIMPTGAGKSICYQIPALLLPGLALVISPLISLMKDQVDGLRRMGIPAAFLNSSLSPQEADHTYQALAQGGVKLLYIAPERMEAEGFASYLSTLPVSLVAVDEAHCVSQWGHDFRPSYRRIQAMIAAFPTRPRVSAFTATATEPVREDILALLALEEPFVLATGFDRPNLYFAVDAPADRDAALLAYLRANPGSTGIVYCITRKQVERIAALLTQKGISARPYHAGLAEEVRRRNQEAFQGDEVEVMVATNAFGMGIDKSNVRFVLHYGMPKTLESYYQEAGRAGRDGEKADCILLYSGQDVMTNRLLIDRQGEQGEADNRGDRGEEYRKLQQMVDYCNGDSCLRARILQYFGAEASSGGCGNCSICLDTTQETDITQEAQKILSCVIRMGNRFGSQMVTQVLRGADTAKVRQFQFQQLSTYGIMKEHSAKGIKEIISFLVARGYLEVGGGEYPVLVVGEKGIRFLKEGGTLYIKRALQAAGRQQRGEGVRNEVLFQRLRALRRNIAARQSVPPYVVFSDATLAQMCSRLPRSMEEMGLVPGVGRVKLEQYGNAFLRAVEAYRQENPALPGQEGEAPCPSEKKEKGMGETLLQALELYQQGLSVEEIAWERGLSPSTVEKHLIDLFRRGEAVDLSAYLPEDHRAALFAAISREGTDWMRPIKDALPEEVTYTQIRFGVELYRAGMRE